MEGFGVVFGNDFLANADLHRLFTFVVSTC